MSTMVEAGIFMYFIINLISPRVDSSLSLTMCQWRKLPLHCCVHYSTAVCWVYSCTVQLCCVKPGDVTKETGSCCSRMFLNVLGLENWIRNDNMNEWMNEWMKNRISTSRSRAYYVSAGQKQFVNHLHGLQYTTSWSWAGAQSRLSQLDCKFKFC